VNYCPAAYNSYDCLVGPSSQNACGEDAIATYWLSCNLSNTSGVSSEVVAVLEYESNSYSFWGHVGNDNFCCHVGKTLRGYDGFKVSGSEYRDVVKLTYTSGTEYNLEHSGGDFSTSIDLNGGDDAFTGSNSTNSLYHDIAWGDSGDDVLTGGGGIDYLDGGAGADTILGGPGADTLYGGDDADTIVGGAGNDECWGDGGADLMSGGDDDDLMDGGTEADGICGGAGTDELDDGDATSESPAYDQLWDLNTGTAICGSNSTRYGGGGFAYNPWCSATALTTAPACP